MAIPRVLTQPGTRTALHQQAISCEVVQFPNFLARWRRSCVISGLTTFSFAVFLGAIVVSAQNVNIKQPSDINAQKQITPDEMRDNAAHVQLQKDEKELGGLCTSISSDIGKRSARCIALKTS